MRDWGDSSDSEPEDEEIAPVDEEPEEPLPQENVTKEHEDPVVEEEPTKRKEVVLPTEPPYKAFIGNIYFEMKEREQLGAEITKLCSERFQDDIKVVGCNLIRDRTTGKMKGYGYVEVETLEMLQNVLKLDDGNSQITGRKIHVEVAAQLQSRGAPNRSMDGGNRSFRGSNRSGISEGGGGSQVDGSSFRGGRYNNNNKNAPNPRPPPARVGPMHRESGDGEKNAPTNPAPAQRPSLKLMPRSQGREDTGANKSSIFGDGKKQDIGQWEQRRQSTAKEPVETKEARGVKEPKGPRGPTTDTKDPTENTTKSNDKNERRAQGRGGRGGRGDGSTGGRTSSNNTIRGGRGRGPDRGSVKDAKKADAPKPATKAPSPVLSIKPAAEAEKKPKVVNKFALLAVDSDSD